ncbi:hypothetical protein BMIN_0304 [Bifidobacterium minimum]|uniref:Uncharacterized protein n=1 Tax=Bifidobacterium minimum TaxID=1693 RepID=A0A087BN09_9BIFI|nr:hypothetical protein BMIN_0304 [Bifidobacterium minimum]
MGRAAGAIIVFAPSPSMTSAPVPGEISVRERGASDVVFLRPA